MPPQLPGRVIVEMARREHRFHHYLWHRVRNSWLRLSQSERQSVREINPEWEPPRPARDEFSRPLRDNDSGEDFLYMHRQMIARVNSLLAEVGDPSYPRIEGWRRVPPPDDGDYPVPEFAGSGLEAVKSPDFYEQFLAPWERRYTDPEYLRGVTLGQLGSDLEFTIHNAMHMRWAAPSAAGYRPTTAVVHVIKEQWDDTAYNYLGDTYASHVNHIFWKLHGWVDDRIEDWKSAQGINGEPEWRGTWLGPQHDGRHHPHHAAQPDGGRDPVADESRRIDRIISASRSNQFDGFFKPEQQSFK